MSLNVKMGIMKFPQRWILKVVLTKVITNHIMKTVIVLKKLNFSRGNFFYLEENNKKIKKTLRIMNYDKENLFKNYCSVGISSEELQDKVFGELMDIINDRINKYTKIFI